MISQYDTPQARYDLQKVVLGAVCNLWVTWKRLLDEIDWMREVIRY